MRLYHVAFLRSRHISQTVVASFYIAFHCLFVVKCSVLVLYQALCGALMSFGSLSIIEFVDCLIKGITISFFPPLVQFIEELVKF